MASDETESRSAGESSITVKSIASYCLVSRSTVRRWIKDGRLSSIRLPSGHYRVSTADFRDFLVRYRIPIKEGLFSPNKKEERR